MPKALPDPTSTAVARPEQRWPDKAEAIAEDPVNDLLVFATGGVMIGTLVAVALTGLAWAAFLGSFGLVFGNFAIRAQRSKKAKLRALVQDALEEQRQAHATELQTRDEQHGRERVALQAEHGRAVSALEASHRATWPLNRSVVIFHRAPPTVEQTGLVTMLLLVRNLSPFDLKLHSPTFVPEAGDARAQDCTTHPSEAPLAAGSELKVTVKGTLPSHARSSPHARVRLNGGMAVARTDDGAQEWFGIVGEGYGDWAKIVEVI